MRLGKIASLVEDSVDCTCLEVGTARSSGLEAKARGGLWKRLPRAGRRQSTSRHLRLGPVRSHEEWCASTTLQSTAARTTPNAFTIASMCDIVRYRPSARLAARLPIRPQPSTHPRH